MEVSMFNLRDTLWLVNDGGVNPTPQLSTAHHPHVTNGSVTLEWFLRLPSVVMYHRFWPLLLVVVHQQEPE